MAKPLFRNHLHAANVALPLAKASGTTTKIWLVMPMILGGSVFSAVNARVVGAGIYGGLKGSAGCSTSFRCAGLVNQLPTVVGSSVIDF